MSAQSREEAGPEVKKGGLQVPFLAGNSSLQREKDDYYKTPEWCTLALLEREEFPGIIWEPACGDGAISRVLPGAFLPIPCCPSFGGHSAGVVSTDLHDRGYGQAGLDFLACKLAVDHVVTNPPYKLAQRFVEHALDCARSKVAMLLKLNFLEGQARRQFFESTPLKTVYVFSRRVSFDKGDSPGKGAGLLAYAWFVWDNQYKGKPSLEWI